MLQNITKRAFYKVYTDFMSHIKDKTKGRVALEAINDVV